MMPDLDKMVEAFGPVMGFLIFLVLAAGTGLVIAVVVQRQEIKKGRRDNRKLLSAVYSIMAIAAAGGNLTEDELRRQLMDIGKSALED